jgi:DNA-binding NtrC family response regulator
MCQTVTRRSVLCIGNDVEARAFLEETLAEYELVFAPNAFEAIRSMHARAFDAYVTDFWLPDWAGPQLCRAIREVDPHCPIVLLSATATTQNRQRAMRAGATAFFCRHEDADDLKPTLRRLLALADAKSLEAKERLEDAVVSEIERCRARLPEAPSATDLRGTFVERTARTRGYKAFVESGGSRAHFERWWPQVFASARANHDAATA